MDILKRLRTIIFYYSGKILINLNEQFNFGLIACAMPSSPSFYHNYCPYRLPQNEPEVQQRKILYMGLYLLIWGEAANVRFMPECLCYIFHNVSAFRISKYNLHLLFSLWLDLLQVIICILLRWHMNSMGCWLEMSALLPEKILNLHMEGMMRLSYERL